MRDHPVPHAEFAGGRAPVGRPRTARSQWILGAVLLACALAAAPAPARAANRSCRTAASARAVARPRPSSPSVSTTTRPVRCATPRLSGPSSGSAMVPLLTLPTWCIRRPPGVVPNLDPSGRQPAGDLPRIDLGEPSTRSARRTDRQRDVSRHRRPRRRLHRHPPRGRPLDRPPRRRLDRPLAPTPTQGATPPPASTPRPSAPGPQPTSIARWERRPDQRPELLDVTQWHGRRPFRHAR